MSTVVREVVEDMSRQLVRRAARAQNALSASILQLSLQRSRRHWTEVIHTSPRFLFTLLFDETTSVSIWEYKSWAGCSFIC
jgi:hypothetical protein